MGSAVVVAAARGIVIAKDPVMLAENGGHVLLSKSWAQSLMMRMGLVKRKVSTKKPTMFEEQFQQRKKTLDQLTLFGNAHDIPSSLIMNWDQTGINVVPVGSYTMADKAANRVEIAGHNDKRQITATLVCTLSGAFQILYAGKTGRCHPKHKFPDGFDIHHTPNHWSNEVFQVFGLKRESFLMFKQLGKSLAVLTKRH